MSLLAIQQRAQQRASGIGFWRLAAGLVLSVLLVGCTSSPRNGVSVVDRANQSSHVGTSQRVNAAPVRPVISRGQYTVHRGDTLFSIAFRFGWDWKALAEHNNIAAPYSLRVGQVIRFGGASAPAVAGVPRSNAAGNGSVTPVNTQPPPPPVAEGPVFGPAPDSSGPQPTTPATINIVPVVSGTSITPPTVTPTVTSAPASERSPTGWAWPSQGVLIGKFSSNGSLNKGIDIAGDLGQPVLAASDGAVVYAGSGLRGYGELVIIKHNDTYVSAYGHNRKLLVREGQQVKVGQTIAEMGSTGTDRVKLHFEIRRQGKPVDPLQFLPRR